MNPDLSAAIKAVRTIIHNLYGSDFASDFGTKAIEGLVEYRADLAADIYKAFTGCELDEAQQAYLVITSEWETPL